MKAIDIIAIDQLKKASSMKEALLYRVIEKIMDVEAKAMARLAEKLPVETMQSLQERILILKENAAKYYLKEELVSASLPIHQSQPPSDPSFTADQKEGDDHSQSVSLQSGQNPELRNVGESLDHSPHYLKPSLFSRAKAFLGIQASKAHLSHDFYPTLSFKQRGKTAGSAYLERWEIRLNPILLAENSDAFINEVIPHEYAHLLTFALYGRVQPHGKEWQMMMTQIMKLPAERTHRFNTKNSQVRQYERFTYYCLCQSHELTAIRHNRVQARKARYFCKHCGESLERRE